MAIRTTSLASQGKKIIIIQGLGHRSPIGSFLILRIDGILITLPFIRNAIKNETIYNPADYADAGKLYRCFLGYIYPKTFPLKSKEVIQEFDNICNIIC